MNKLKSFLKTCCPSIFNLLRIIKRTGIGMYTLLVKFHVFRVDDLIVSDQILQKMTYEDLYNLQYVAEKERYTSLLANIVKHNVKTLQNRETICIAFILYDTSMWCGDALYRKFAEDSRFHSVVFLCLRADVASDIVSSDFQRGIEQFRKAGIEVYPIIGNECGRNFPVDPDICFYLTPYDRILPSIVSLGELYTTKLLCYMHYSLDVWAGYDLKTSLNYPLIQLAWMNFVATKVHHMLFNQFAWLDSCHYTGYPRMDTFYDSVSAKYIWKCVNDKVVRIIWAPHWSIDDGARYATFQHNYRFFLEYAKTHQETTSWIVKPHPNLLFSAVKSGIFQTEADFKRYLSSWDALSNAKVVTGGYYHEIFKTSDAMILDSISFLAEYQYTHKPLLFLTRKGELFNILGKSILDVSYIADGKDFEKIRTFIEDVVIGGKDTLCNERRKIFHEMLDYKKDRGLIANENIYNLIAEALQLDI